MTVYLIGGILYLSIARKARGVEMIPNYIFWKKLSSDITVCYLNLHDIILFIRFFNFNNYRLVSILFVMKKNKQIMKLSVMRLGQVKNKIISSNLF